jgi:hypothetical protein
MKLLHYSDKPFALDARRYEQSEGMKPRGLWLSVEDAWAEWCRGEEFCAESLTHVQEVKLDGTLNLKHLRTADEVLAFSDEFHTEELRVHLDWPRVAGLWDGLLISPYQCSVRLDDRASWYYSWDCASACVWNLKQTTLEPGSGPSPQGREAVGSDDHVEVAVSGTIDREDYCVECGKPMIYRVDPIGRQPVAMFCGKLYVACSRALLEVPRG